NAPLGLDTRARVAMLGQPWRVPLLLWRLARCWRRLSRAARGLARPDAVLVAYLGHFDVHLARRLFRGVPIVLDHFISGSDTAQDRGLSGPLRNRLLTFIDDAALRAADIAIVDTDEHRDLMPVWAQPKGVVVPVGASEAWFAARREVARRSVDGPLRVVFFGQYTPLQGTPTIAAA